METVLQWIQRNYGKKYDIWIYDERIRTYKPYQDDIRRIYNEPIERYTEIKTNKFVFNKKTCQMELEEPRYRLFVRQRRG